MKSKSTKFHLFQVNFPDIDQMDSLNFDSFFSEISSLFNTNSSNFFKFKFFDGECFVETDLENLEIPETELIPINQDQIPHPWGALVYSNITIKNDYFKINGIYHRLIGIKDFPTSLDTAQLCSYGNYFLNLKKIKNSQAKKILDLKRKMHHANNNKEIRNLESENAKSQSEDLMEQLILGEESLFLVEAWFIISANSEKDLNQKTKNTTNDLKLREITPFIEDIGLSALFPILLPKNLPLWVRANYLPTSYLINCLPLRRDYLHEDGIELYSRQMNKIKIDIFDKASFNFNCLISGHSGSGKSVLAQKITDEYQKNGVSTLILDRGGSFLKLTKYHKGNIFNGTFNPLQFKNPTYLTQFFLSAIPNIERTQKFEGKLFRVIKETLKNNQLNDFSMFLKKIEAKIPDIGLFFEELLPFLCLKNSPINPITYVDTEYYPDKVLPSLIIFLIEYFKNLEGPKMFIFDECWHLLQNNLSYVGECFRTFRKQGASAVAITQQYSDFLETPIGRAIATNSYYKFIFSQELKESEHFDNFDIERINSLKTKNHEFSEFYLKTPFNKKIIRYVSTPLEYEIFTSNFEENRTFNEFNKEYENYFSFREIIEKWSRLKYA